MVANIRQKATLEEFESFVEHPENSEAIFEFINGEIVEVPFNAFASKIAAKILTFIGMFLLEHDIGHVTGADGGYMVNGDRYAPDVAYISYERQPELAKKGYNSNPPELAVEVISDKNNTEEHRILRLKLSNYLAAGVVVWIVDPEDQVIEVHTPGKASQEIDEEGILTAEDILPGFKLPVKNIFRNLKKDEP